MVDPDAGLGIIAAFGPGSGPVGEPARIAPTTGPGASEPPIVPMPRVHLRAPHDDTRLILPTPPALPGPSGQPSRYQLIGELARGGMGAILQGRDPDLGRDLVLKVIREEHRDQPELVCRFVEEAQIAGQLQHPGIVPVYELGRLPDGRLFIAMKLVRGRTLAALLETRWSPDEDRMRFLSIFEQVCQTMAYAHARGVIHRDLKPSNVMVGSFGEVQVMDWGLAKVLEPGEAAKPGPAFAPKDDSAAVRTLRTGSVMESRTGSVLGTPSYMAPEQARGAMDTLDERADVFSLGSILCEILTGRPAFAGESGVEVYRKAERADLADAQARLDACGADPELVALARSCLSAAPKHRPRDAGMVVAGLTAYLQGVERRLREAELAHARAEARAVGERRRRFLASALAVTVLGTTLIGAAGWAWLDHDRRNRDGVRGAAVDAALAYASRKREQARASGRDPVPWVEATEAARRAESLLAGGDARPEERERVRAFLAGLVREREAADAVEKDRRIVERLAAILNDFGVHSDHAKADAEYASAFREYGVDLDRLEPGEAGKVLAASPAAADLASALDQWASLRRGRALHNASGAERLDATARLADPDPWRNRLRDTLGRREGDPARRLESLEKLAATADVERLPVASTTRLATSLAFLGRREKAIQLLRRSQTAHRNDFWVNADLGRELIASGRPDEAVRFFAVATGVRPTSGIALSGLGRSLLLGGQQAEAAEVFRELIRLRPDDALARVALGSALLALGEPHEAAAEFGEATRMRAEDWMVRDQIALAYSDRGDWSSAVEEQAEAVRRFPTSAVAHKALAHALQSAGRIDEAIAEFREAVRIDPLFSSAYLFLGRAMIETGDYQAAIDALARVAPGPPSMDASLSPTALSARARQMMALEPRLPAILEGCEQPTDPEEGVAFARLAFARQEPLAAAELWFEAFTASPELAADLASGNRFQAARAAALAGCERGAGIGGIETPSRSRWRRQSIDWLKADLAASAAILEMGPSVQRATISRRLGRWQVDPCLAGLRDERPLSTLPESERQALTEFWRRVEDARAGATTPRVPDSEAQKKSRDRL